MTVQDLIDALQDLHQPEAQVSVVGEVMAPADNGPGYVDVMLKCEVLRVYSTHPNYVKVEVRE